MASKSKSKGASWERDLAKFLTTEFGAPFIRTPNSGAFIGGQNFARRENLTEGQTRHSKGDIVPPDNWKHFNCEAKNYASFPFHRLLFNKPVPLLEEWLEQLMDAADPEDINILYFKITRTGRFVVFENDISFTATRGLEYVDAKERKWTITEFDHFFELNKITFQTLHER